MFKFLKKAKKKERYKCSSCGSTSEEGGGCCGGSREKECNCGSDKFAKDCCGA
ncbi:hypothetical protein MYX07_04260 [Patescibacteria group bacterium AH-259-L07]|nr:hypothetical protein [Patescibacteria group bacterium AH-259-L07]